MHVWAGFQNAPEQSNVVLEGTLADGTLTGCEAFAVEFKSLGRRIGSCGEKHISVGAIRRNCECLPRKSQSSFQVQDFPGLIDEILSPAE